MMIQGRIFTNRIFSNEKPSFFWMQNNIQSNLSQRILFQNKTISEQRPHIYNDHSFWGPEGSLCNRFITSKNIFDFVFFVMCLYCITVKKTWNKSYYYYDKTIFEQRPHIYNDHSFWVPREVFVTGLLRLNKDHCTQIMEFKYL